MCSYKQYPLVSNVDELSSRKLFITIPWSPNLLLVSIGYVNMPLLSLREDDETDSVFELSI